MRDRSSARTIWVCTALAALALPPRAARAEEPVDRGKVCYLPPLKVTKVELDRILKVLEAAAQETQPSHVAFELVRIRSPKKEGPALGCRAIVDVSVKRTKVNEAELIVDATRLDGSALVKSSVVVSLKDVESEALRPAWTRIWNELAPPLPPPKPAPVAEKPFVDQELIAAQRAEHPVVVEHERGPIAAIHVGAGFFSRTLDGAPGTTVERADLLSLEVDGVLHLASLARAETIELDVAAGYARRLASGRRGGTDVGITADRVRATAALRYVFGASGPSLGVLAGWELLRFELDPTASALSLRWSVVRAGLSLRAPLVELTSGRLVAFADAAARLAPGADGGEAGLGLDGSLGLELELESGFLARLGGEYARQPGQVAGRDVTDAALDVHVSVGWAL